jgi:hypothetical protein
MRRSLALFALLWIAGCGGGGNGGGLGSPSTNQWTVLVYMNAANSLYADSAFNVEQMQQAASNSKVKIVIEWKQSTSVNPGSSFNGTRRYLILPGSSASVQSKLVQDLGTGIDMGEAQTLSDFIAWGKANYPAQRYALVLWDHGNGWRPKSRPTKTAKTNLRPAFSYDDETGNAIQIWQLPAALGDEPFDMVVWDCSLMQMAEVADELRPNTRYVVGSEESPPATGFPYDSVLRNFQNDPGADTLTLAKTWVDDMNAVPGYVNDPIEESVIDTSALSAFSASGGPIDTFARALISGLPGDSNATATIRTQGKSYLTTASPPRYYYDLGDMAAFYQTLSTDASIQTSAQNLLKALPSVVVYEKHNANSSGSEGMSIDFSPATTFISAKSEYQELAFGQANDWGLWLQSDL